MKNEYRDQQGWSVLPCLFLRQPPSAITDLIVQQRHIANFELDLLPTEREAVARARALLEDDLRVAERWLEELSDAERPSPNGVVMVCRPDDLAKWRREATEARRIALEGLRVVQEWERQQS
jgi:hypothetical protein